MNLKPDLLFLVFVVLVEISLEFSDFRLPVNTVMCSILQKTKCEWKYNWTDAEGVRRELDAGKPPVQFFYFCKGNRTEKCGIWLDENNEPVDNSITEDRLVGDVFIIEQMSFQVLGDYHKIPEKKGDKQLIIE